MAVVADANDLGLITTGPSEVAGVRWARSAGHWPLLYAPISEDTKGLVSYGKNKKKKDRFLGISSSIQ
ncbi:hypothetical protein M0804_010704 [Polistes exclamans]|nr:hypothetical protein M0804_010704 [Polistes exclamans]